MRQYCYARESTDRDRGERFVRRGLGDAEVDVAGTAT